MEILKISSKTKSTRVAGSLVKALEQADEAELRAIGPFPVNQAVKAVAIVAQRIDLTCVPVFGSTEIEGQKTVTICLIVQKIPKKGGKVKS